MSEWPWDELEIAQTRDKSAIRKAYSAKLKRIDLDNEIQAYARLREARGYALFLANQPEVEEDDLSPRGLDDNPVSTLAGGNDDSDGWSDSDDWSDDLLPDAAEAGPTDSPESAQSNPPPQQYESDTSSPAESFHQTEPDPEAQRIEAAWQQLDRLVFPDGKQSDEGFTHEEWEEAKAALNILLETAATGQLDQHGAIEFHLSELLAAGWPRSAPLVEPADEEFNWFAEVGQITERPALQFLNARLAGMRFHDAVELPDHKFHKAWQYLADGSVSMRKAGKQNVADLIIHIRTYHPELESLLDGQKIFKLESDESDNEAATSLGKFFFFGLIPFIILLRVCSSLADDRSTADDVLSGEFTSPAMMEAQIAYRDLVPELLGEEWPHDRLEQTSPQFARSIENAVFGTMLDSTSPDQDRGEAEARYIGRRLILGSREQFDFADKVRAHALLLGWLRAARSQGLAHCDSILNGDDWADLELGDPTLSNFDTERELLNVLLAKGDPFENQQTGETRANVPGWIIGEIMTKTGLTNEQVVAALASQDHPESCDVMIAMMEVVAASPGKAPAELLALP